MISDLMEDQAELRKEVEKVKEARNEGKWGIIGTRNGIIKDKDKKYNNKDGFGTLWILSGNFCGFP